MAAALWAVRMVHPQDGEHAGAGGGAEGGGMGQREHCGL